LIIPILEEVGTEIDKQRLLEGTTDTFALAQGLLQRGGDVERRFSLISLDNSFEIILRAYLLKKGIKRADVDTFRKVDDLLWMCERAGLDVSESLHT